MASSLRLGSKAVAPQRGPLYFFNSLLAYAKEADLPASAVISNVFVSLQFGGEGGFGTLTLTLPTTGRLTNQAYAADAGLTMDLERPERFTPRALGIAAFANPR
jgi:hypothetical protein